MRCRRVIAVISVFLLCPGVLFAGDKYLGTFYSFKNSGVCFLSINDSSRQFSKTDLILDFSGLFSGVTDMPGYSLRYARGSFLRDWELPTGTKMHLFAGPGAIGGYLRDFDGVFGPTFAMSGMAGLFFEMERGVSLSLSFSADLGVHVKSIQGRNTLRLYRNGLIRSFSPEVHILFRLR